MFAKTTHQVNGYLFAQVSQTALTTRLKVSSKQNLALLALAMTLCCFYFVLYSFEIGCRII